MIPFSLEMPAAIHFGSGSLKKLPEVVAGFGKRVLLVGGSGWLASSGREEAIVGSLGDIIIQRVYCPPEEPTTDSLATAAASASDFRPDVIVAI
jgi:alcohol dehydrogenase class IV